METGKKSKAAEHDRHSRSGISGAPKKGGAGGKGTWGKGGIDDLNNPAVAGPKDPNYNSDEEKEETVIQKVEVMSPVEAIIKEYLVEGDIQETARSLKEKNIAHPEFVRKCMVISMEKEPFERELVSKLLSALYSAAITPDNIAEGFQQALDKLEDYVLDAPNAVEMLGKFLARAVVDEIIPPAFLTKAAVPSKLAKESVALAHGLVTDNHRSKKIEHIWGPGDLESVKRLKEEVAMLIEEYLTSGDQAEADRCVRKLNAPHFHFQVVKQALRMALQKSEEERKKVLSLLAFFYKEGLITSEQMSQGFRACKDALGDIKLDAPNAVEVFEAVSQIAKQSGWLSS